VKTLRIIWWPIGLMLRLTTWLVFPPAGWLLGRRRRHRREHRELVAASTRVVHIVPAGPPIPPAPLSPTYGVAPPGPGCRRERGGYPYCDCAPNGPCAG
jgi:hypothetical protein